MKKGFKYRPTYREGFGFKYASTRKVNKKNKVNKVNRDPLKTVWANYSGNRSVSVN